MHIKLGYGKGFQEAEVADSSIIKIIEQNEIDDAKADVPVSVPDIIRGALAEPIGTERLRDIVKPGEKIAIITSDITRPMPTWEVMPYVLEELAAAGITEEDAANDVTLVFALGSQDRKSVV